MSVKLTKSLHAIKFSRITKALIFSMLYKALNSFAKKHNVNIVKNVED